MSRRTARIYNLISIIFMTLSVIWIIFVVVLIASG